VSKDAAPGALIQGGSLRMYRPYGEGVVNTKLNKSHTHHDPVSKDAAPGALIPGGSLRM
jgi:hypothetical protein